jgi:hypothetical protein
MERPTAHAGREAGRERNSNIDDISNSQIEQAIDELEMSPATYQNAEKLATFYQLYDHLYTQREPERRIESTREVTIDRYGDSEFLQAIEGKKATEVWSTMDELLSTIRALQPKLYQATIDRIRDQR